jgi:NAD+ diphosphatase
MIPFCGNPLDRASEKRTDSSWVADRYRDPNSLILPLWKLQPFIIGPENQRGPLEAGFLKPGLAEVLMASDAPIVLLGVNGNSAYFAIDISGSNDPANEGPLTGLGHFRDLRAAAMSGLVERDIAILGQAKAMIDWHQRHGFCPKCGSRTALGDAGYRRHCDVCGADHFPRTDPVVIMLATHGDACLVGRGKQFPPGFFSALAGFVEPGETVEEAVTREIHEEAGVRVKNVRYFTSQPWPFPSSLMMGCFAEAEDRALTIDHNELADAFWIEKDKLRAILAGENIDGLRFPPPVAIAHHLLKHWTNG